MDRCKIKTRGAREPANTSDKALIGFRAGESSSSVEGAIASIGIPD